MPEYDYPTAFSSWRPGDGSDEDRAIQRVLASGRLTMGPEVEAFEHEFAAWHGMNHGIMVNSGSSANLIAVAALFNKSDGPLFTKRPIKDRAIVPAIAWSTTYAPLIQHGMELKLVDVDDTWNAPIHEVLGLYAVRLIVVCSILGNPAYAAEWCDLASKLSAYVIEDNCESLGASRNGQRSGTFGIMSTFSFFYSHHISAIEGGMILTNDDECARLCRILRAHGWTRDVEKPKRFQDEYNFTHFGNNVRPLEMHAAVAREQLKKLDHFNMRRAENYILFRSVADKMVKFPDQNGLGMVPFGLAFEVESEERRAALVQAFRNNGIDCRLPTGGSFRLHRYGRDYADQQTPRADRVHRHGLFLGNAPFDISDKIERAVKVMKETL